MSERWKPENGERYWIIAFSEVVQSTWRADIADLGRWQVGNCFKTKEEAVTALKKITSLLLSLHEPVTECNQLPKLTMDVFDRPDCPDWAKYAAVDESGHAYWYSSLPKNEIYSLTHQCVWHNESKHFKIISGKFDASDWKNSLIERPAKLPEWCKVGEWVWATAFKTYFKVDEVDALFVGGKSVSGGDYSVKIENVRQARLRPYNAEEMKALVGTVIEKGPSMHIVTGFENVFDNECMVHANGCLYGANDLLRQFTIDGSPCGVPEHLENGEWVE